jgi:hypothetical protein
MIKTAEAPAIHKKVMSKKAPLIFKIIPESLKND